MLLQHTAFETGYTNSFEYFCIMLLGCGVIVIHDHTMLTNAKNAGYKLHTIGGRTVGFALFTRQV